MAEALALLVGGNPLPNYLAATILAREPGWDRAVLFYTAETEAVKKRLAQALGSLGPVEDRFVRDAGDPVSVRQAWERMPDSVHLHYTGGTKAMAVHLYEAWLETVQTGTSWRRGASYLDERSGTIRFADGTERSLEAGDIQLDLGFLVELHGLESLTSRSPKDVGPDLPADLEVMTGACLEDPGRARQVYQSACTNGAFDAASPLDLPNLGLAGLSAATIPDRGWSVGERSAWRKFLRGDWLEIWVGALVEELVEPHPVKIGFEARREGRQFEVDVVALRGHRLYLISCTTDMTASRCKTKLFEAAFRARQLGGDLARASLACLYDQPNKIRKDVAASWDPTNVPEAFGLQHLRDWHAGRTESLRRWLES
jgi:hypothetical protein